MRKTSHTVQPRPVQPLLFRQILVLMGILGAASFSYSALVALALLVPVLDSRCREKQGRGRFRLLLCALCLGLGFGWAWLCQPVLVPVMEREGVDETENASEPVHGEITAQILEVQGMYDRRLRVTLAHVQVQTQPEKTSAEKAATENLPPVLLHGCTTWTLEGWPKLERPIPGQQVRFFGKILPILGFRNDDTDGGQHWWARQGIFWRVWSGADTTVTLSGEGQWAAELREKLRQKLMSRLQGLYPDPYKRLQYGVPSDSAPRGSGFVPALLFGDRYYMGVEDWNRLSHAGLLHSIALSGQHLAVTGLLAGLVLWLAGLVWPALFLYRPRVTLGFWLALPLAVVYLWLGNAPNSLMRSALMLGCVGVVSTVRRPYMLMDSLLWALALMVLAEPGIVQDVGAQLSFLAVFGLVLIGPLLSRWRLRALGHPWLLGAGGLLLCSGIIQISTLPVTLTAFGWVTPWWWLNLLWLPVLGVWVLPLCVLALVAVALGMGVLADAALVLAVEPCGLLLEGLRSLGSSLEPLWCLRPYWVTSVGLLVLLVGVALLFERARSPLNAQALRTSRVLCVAGFVLLLSGSFVRLFDGLVQETRLRLLDVGQGQAALLEFPGERRFLVDGGGVRSSRFDTGRYLIAPVLTRNRPPRLDALILSHPDMDHLRGLLFLGRYFMVGEAVLPVGVSGHDTARSLFAEYLRILREKAIPVREVQAGEEIEAGTSVLEVLAPLPNRPLASNDGLILRLRHNGQGLVILPGDATRSLLGALARESRTVQAEILVAPHHGSRQNVREDFLHAVAARELWVSCAAFNRYGFPAEALQTFCAENGIVLRQTATEGEIDFSWNRTP